MTVLRNLAVSHSLNQLYWFSVVFALLFVFGLPSQSQQDYQNKENMKKTTAQSTEVCVCMFVCICFLYNNKHHLSWTMLYSQKLPVSSSINHLPCEDIIACRTFCLLVEVGLSDRGQCQPSYHCLHSPIPQYKKVSRNFTLQFPVGTDCQPITVMGILTVTDQDTSAPIIV